MPKNKQINKDYSYNYYYKNKNKLKEYYYKNKDKKLNIHKIIIKKIKIKLNNMHIIII